MHPDSQGVVTVPGHSCGSGPTGLPQSKNRLLYDCGLAGSKVGDQSKAMRRAESGSTWTWGTTAAPGMAASLTYTATR